jgi:hypothetical protein
MPKGVQKRELLIGIHNNGVTALNAVTGQLVDEPRALAVGGPGGPWNCKYLHQPA